MQIGKTSNGVLNHAKPQIQTQQITIDRLKLQVANILWFINVKSEYFHLWGLDRVNEYVSMRGTTCQSV